MCSTVADEVLLFIVRRIVEIPRFGCPVEIPFYTGFWNGIGRGRSNTVVRNTVDELAERIVVRVLEKVVRPLGDNIIRLWVENEQLPLGEQIRILPFFTRIDRPRPMPLRELMILCV